MNSTQINFGGYEWVVIGNAGKDIYTDGSTYGGAGAKPDSVTLLSKNNDFGTSAFRASGSGVSYRNEYQGSTLQVAMDNIANGLPGKEQDVINLRNLVSSGNLLPTYSSGTYPELDTNDGMNGANATGQMLWALSLPEWRAIANGAGSGNATTVRSYPSNWWLRSPDDDNDYALNGLSDGGYFDVRYVTHNAPVVRPAFNLGMASVLFTSDASTGKSAATAGGAYTTLTLVSSTAQKFTFLDTSIATPTLTLKLNALDFDFAGAPTGAIPNGAKYVSGFLYNGTNDFYAKYASTTTSPTGNFNAKPASDGNYELHIFNEEANTYLYSDFASQSVDFTFTVNSGTVENLTLTSDSAFGLDGGTIGLLAQDYTKAWTLGAGGGTFAIQNGVNAEISGVISGSGGLTKDGAGTLTLSGANIYSGLTEVKNGTLALTGTLSNSSVVLNAGNSTLDVYHGGSIGGDLNAANANINFYVPTNAANGDTMLNVTGKADISGSTVNVDFDGASSPLKVDNQIQLINAAGGLTGEPSSKTSDQWRQGVSLQYEFDISTTSNQLLATVTVASVNPQTKSFSEARLSQLAFINQGSDLIAGQGLFAALDATARRTNMKETTTFGALSGGSSRYKTGSHSDVTGLSLITGLAGNSRLALGKLTLGAFFEYGNANYDSYNSFTNAASVRGNGNIDYTGGGVLAHLEFNPTARGNAWLESSARFGRATVDFQTNDMLGNLGKRTAFDSNSNYAAAHIGAGYHWKLTKQNGFDLYAQYLWSRQNADTVTLTTGETVKFETANSERLRLGSRFVYNLNPHRRAFAGIAWEHEFDGEANASIFDYRLDTPKLKGDTCKLELGLTLQPTKTCPITRNFGIQGYTGKREGVAGSIEVRYEF